MFFSNKAQLSDAMDSLISSGFIDASDSRLEYEIVWHHSKVREMFDSVESVIIKKPRVKTKKESEADENEDVRVKIFNHYKTLGNLKQQSKLTDFLRTSIDTALSTYKEDDILEALSYANSVEWLANSIDKLWNNAGWVIKNIDKFMDGGKYRTSNKEVQKEVVISKYYSNDTILTL
ncbi:MAG: hypothetical protein RR744_00430 [Cellulosilyticaceae bacterium]